MYNIIATGSKGNAVIYLDNILVDTGVSFSKLEPYITDIELILISHKHSDHLKLSTIKKMQQAKPSIRVGCGEFLLTDLPGVKNIDIYSLDKWYDYGTFKISPIQLYHDVPNFGFRIWKDKTKIIHATDTYTLDGITAKEYDLYALECNYDETRVYDIIREKRERGEYAHQQGSINSHLSLQQAQDFFINNKADHSQMIQLHQSSEF